MEKFYLEKKIWELHKRTELKAENADPGSVNPRPNATRARDNH